MPDILSLTLIVWADINRIQKNELQTEKHLNGE